MMLMFIVNLVKSVREQGVFPADMRCPNNPFYFVMYFMFGVLTLW